MLDLFAIYGALCDDLHIDSSDRQYLLRRINSEGLGFVTSTLPAFSKCVLHAIEIGNFYEAIRSHNFTSIARKGRSLRYFRSLLDKLFDSETGNLLEKPCPLALRTLRILCEYTYKLSLPFSEHQLASFQDQFVKEDLNVGATVDPTFLDDVRKNVEKEYLKFLTIDPHSVLVKYPPRPGPGSYSGSAARWYEWKNHPCPERYRNFIVGPLKKALRRFGINSSLHQPNKVKGVDYSELLFVPKDSRGPRVIVREPKDNLLFQLSFQDWFTDYIQRATAGRIQFVSQVKNRELAHRGSLDGSIATIDLKNASDAVSWSVTSQVFRNFPTVSFFLKRFRTPLVRLPDGQLHLLRKLSGMGSGFTFPIMAFLCHASICTAIMKVHGTSFAQASRQVYVFGDDICVPTKYVRTAIEGLTKLGFTPNLSKSYAAGPFRESCGGDYLHGYDVAPIRLKLSSSQLEPCAYGVRPTKKDEFINELSQHCKELHLHGLFNLQRLYEGIISRMVRTFPYCSNFEFNGVVRYRKSAEYVPDIQTGTYPTVKVYVYKPETSPFNADFTYRFYGKIREGFNPLEFSRSVDYHKVDIPRRGSLRAVRVSAFALCTGNLGSCREVLLY